MKTVKYRIRFIWVALFSLCSLAVNAQVQEKEKSPEELAYEEAQRLEKTYKLQPHQTFFVDSVLQHDMRAMYDEMQYMQNSGVREYTIFEQVRQKWTEQIEKSYAKIFSEDQWMLYRRDTGKLSKEERKALKKKLKKEKEERSR